MAISDEYKDPVGYSEKAIKIIKKWACASLILKSST
jgi:hypothetical protein